MIEYVEREAVRLAYEKSLEANRHNIIVARAVHTQEHRHILHVLDKVPAVDVVEVVRCRDCENITPVEGGLPLCALHGIACSYNDFCSFGKRRDK